MTLETELQMRFAASYTRILRTGNPAYAAWVSGPFRDLVCGVWPKATTTTLERALTVFLEGEGVAAERYQPPRGQPRGEAVMMVRGKHHGFRAGLVSDDSFSVEPPRGTDVERYVVLAVLPVRVHAWRVSAAELGTETMTVVPAHCPWGPGGLAELLSDLRRG